MNLESPHQKWWGFFFKLFFIFIWIFKICLYLCEILITKTKKMKSKTQIKIGLIIASYFIIRTLINI